MGSEEMVSENCLTEPQGPPSAGELDYASVMSDNIIPTSAIQFKVDGLNQQSILPIQYSSDIKKRFQEIRPRTDRVDVFMAKEVPKLRKYFLSISVVTLGDEWS